MKYTLVTEIKKRQDHLKAFFLSIPLLGLGVYMMYYALNRILRADSAAQRAYEAHEWTTLLFGDFENRLFLLLLGCASLAFFIRSYLRKKRIDEKKNRGFDSL